MLASLKLINPADFTLFDPCRRPQYARALIQQCKRGLPAESEILFQLPWDAANRIPCPSRGSLPFKHHKYTERWIHQ
ncbi:hypothetical protein N431DRAFT_25375 [Stipitochalara longipes BDJ]|nr:hypothetical protein N431DRAFT_25375 [Stipitochalara longipes BDJ]